MSQTSYRGTAERIGSTLTALGLKVPKSLTEALAAVDAAVSASDSVAQVDIDRECMTVKATDVADLVARTADALARRDAVIRVSGDITSRLERRLSRVLLDIAPEVIDSIGPSFTDAAKNFEAAHRRLPADYTDAERLIRAGSEAVAAFEDCRAAMQVLDAVAGVRNQVARLGIKAVGEQDVEQGTRYATVTNTAAARRAGSAGSNSLGTWGALLCTPGVTGLRWRNVTEHAKYIATLPQAEDKWERVDNNGFAGYRLVTA